MRNVFGMLLLSVLFACGEKQRTAVDESQFASYWYQNKAEINVYALDQVRYGEIRKGEAVMIFVTEDFSTKKQVKLDNPQRSPSDARKVLKLNKTREFQTGVYPYNTMLSVFTPVYEELNSPKVVASVTEWCGQSFTQMNWRNSNYNVQQFSYFESEGDQDLKINAQSEDELWNLIRLNPDLIEEGISRLIPGLVYQRFSHVKLQVENASISKTSVNASVEEVQVEYQDLSRKLSIRYQKSFPHEILSWEESEVSSAGDTLVTKAIRKKKQMLDYWNLNSKSDEELAKSLSL
ncbi:hypothetical protein ACFOSV_10405 [Algoriphagus namhaensis]|uniref:Septum formation inhibitor Maf n=1 Tax=Algoriphagus namhaensis TaxID=915353 RepID=A0ABV8AUF7_9BACT